MALPASTLSLVCRSVQDFLSDGLDAADQSIQVTVGSPGSAPPPTNGDTHHRVNLFFYRIDPFGFGTDGAPDEIGWVRLHCLITAFGVLEDKISGGENDLRLLGEVMRLFHETPILAPLDVGGETIRLQVVFQPLGTDEINHLWSTQGDLAYRTSVAYEMAVIPIIPKKAAVGSPLAGAIGSDVRGAVGGAARAFQGLTFVPEPDRVSVNTSVEAWVPHIAFLYQDSFAYSLAFTVGSDELTAFVPRVVILGEPGAAVTLRWDQWTSETGWETTETETAATPTGPMLDPDDADAPTTEVTLPFRDHGGQAVLYAVREFTRATDGAVVRARSNPLLITLVEPAA